MIPFHNHSEYSALDGLSTPEEIAQRCVDIGCPCCGLTDHGVVSGHLHFSKALKAKGIKPIFGVELYQGTKTSGFKGNERDQHHLVALAKTDEGLRNLWRLVNATADESHFRNVGRVFWDDLQKYKEGLVVTSACALGLVCKGLRQDDYSALNNYLEIFGDQFYIEIHTYPITSVFRDRDSDEGYTMDAINEGLVNIAQERGIPLIYANDAHYAFPEQWEYHDMYVALQTRQQVDTPVEERTMYHPPGALCIMDEAHVREALSYLPASAVDEAISNSDLLAEQCNASLPESRDNMPVFIPAECPWVSDEQKKMSSVELFVDLVEVGIRNHYGEDNEEAWERALREAETLINDGIYEYFLWGWDEVQFVDSEGIERGPGRGSSAGCIIAYALGITDVDPLHYGLSFERFWNSGRADGFPDIDSDFSTTGRVAIREYLERRLGKDRVCAIGTTGRLKPKATIDRLSRGCGIRDSEADELKKIVDGTTDLEIHGVDQIGWNPKLEPGKVIYVKECVGDLIDEWILADPDREEVRYRFVQLCEHVCSRVQQYGIHASGIVISNHSLPDHLPAYLRGPKESRVAATMFDMSEVDKLHFIKLDVLGLRTLDTLAVWKSMMADKGIDIQWSGLDRQEWPQEMWDMMHTGFTAGVFQIETSAGRRLCGQMNAASMNDLIIINALNRPGPDVDRFLAKRNGKLEITYQHARLEEILGPVLAPTYGEFVFQEQVIAYFNGLGYNLSESDAVRKIMGKKMPESLAALHDGEGEWKDRGYLAMTDRAGIPERAAQNVWDGLERFASYAFNKSHAVSYAIIGFRCLFAKYYAPAEFYAACIQTVEGEKYKEMLPLYINEARRMGIDVYPPDIYKSKANIAVTDGDLYFGFKDIKDVSSSGDYLTQLRESKTVDVSTPDAFIESFESHNKAYLKQQKTIKDEGGVVEGKSPKQKLRANQIANVIAVGAWRNYIPDDRTMAEQQELENELLGVILTDNSAEAFQNNAERIAMCDSWEDLLKPFDIKLVESGSFYQEEVGEDPDFFDYTVPGVVAGVTEKRSKAGESYAKIVIEYESDTLEFVVFHRQWKSNKFMFRMRTPGIFSIRHKPDTEWGESYSFQKGFILR